MQCLKFCSSQKFRELIVTEEKPPSFQQCECCWLNFSLLLRNKRETMHFFQNIFTLLCTSGNLNLLLLFHVWNYNSYWFWLQSVAKKKTKQWSVRKHGELHVLINLKYHSYSSIPSQNKQTPSYTHFFF